MAEILGDSTANNLVGSGNGNDSIVGFEGDDTLWVDWNWNIGNNTLDGGTGSDYLYAYSNSNLLRGGDDNDILEVYDWNNTLEGGLGDDTYNLYYASGNTIQDAGGTDILSTGLKLSLNGLAVGEAGLEKQGTSLVIDINQDGVADTSQDLVILDFFNAAGTGAGTGFIEKIDYLDGNEIITPPSSPNIITGTANADNLEGTNANDSMIADAGDDSISSDGSGNDTLLGGDGNDNLIDFGAGHDFLDGGMGNDTLDGGMGSNTLDGGAGDDYLSSNQYYYYSGYSDQDSLFGGDGNDTLLVGSYWLSNTLDGGAGADSLYSSYSDSSLFRGGEDNDILEVYGWNNTLEGGLGDDTYNLYYASGNTIQDAGGTDILQTGLKLSLNGLAVGEAGLEKQGTSLVIDINQDGVADTSQDLVILDFFNAAGTGAGTGFIEKIDYLDGNEIITPPSSPNIITGTANADNLEGTNANDSMIADAGDDSISSDGSGNDTLLGGDGNDNLIDVGVGHDFLDGGMGNDTLDGGMGSDTLDGGGGDDYLSDSEDYYYYSSQDSLFGGDGNDTLVLNYGNYNSTLDGGTGADSLYSSYSDISLLLGGDDDDILEVGYGGNNTLEGGLGDDTLSLIGDGGSGNIFRGGSGSDIYRVRAGYWGQAGVEIDDTEGTDTLIILESQFQNGEIFDPMPVEPISAVDPMPVEPISAVDPMPVEPTPVVPAVPLNPTLVGPALPVEPTPISVDLPVEPTEVTETPMTLSATGLAAGIAGLGRMGTSLVIDTNKDGWADQWSDVSITNFFDAAGTGAGSGFIETVGNLSGEEILAAELPEVTFEQPIWEPPIAIDPLPPEVVDNSDANDPPLVTNPISGQSHDWNENFSLTLEPNTFTDPEGGELTYSATQVSFVDWTDGEWQEQGAGPLPDWLTFDPATLTFSTEDTDRSFFIEIEVTATDPEGAIATDWFRLWSNGIDGIAIDGYIADATAFLDVNRNGALDAEEPNAITTEEGRFTFNIDPRPFDLNNNGRLDPEEGRIVISGGTDTATGLPLATPLVATPDTTTVTMLSNVVSDLVDQGVSKADAETQVKTALGIPAGIDLSNTDPIAATAQNQAGGVQLNSAMVKLQNAVTQMANTISGASSLSVAQSSQTVVGAIADQVKSGATLDLTNASQLQTVLEAAGNKAQVDLGELSESIAQIIAEANERIDTVVANNTGADLNQELARVQSVALGKTSDDLNAAAAGQKAIASVVAANTGNALDTLISNTKLGSEVTDSSDNNPLDIPVAGSESEVNFQPTSSSNLMPVAPAGGGAVAIFSLPTILPSSPETIKLGRPTANATDPGAPTGEAPNQVMGEFYNLSDSDDNIAISQITEAIGLHVRGLSGKDVIQGSEGGDIVNGNQGNDIVKGRAGNDALRGGQGADDVDGESDDDVLNGNQDNDNLFGGDGNDLLRGGKGDDNLFGGNGNDVLCGDMGQDFLTGDGGSDTFVLRSGEAAASTSKTADVILDFNSSEDKIGLTDGVTYQNLTFEAVNFGLGDASAIASVAIKADNKYLGIVQGFTEEDLTASMFVKADDLILFG
jgi:Ca2+-binding RTX toxin-like protein